MPSSGGVVVTPSIPVPPSGATAIIDDAALPVTLLSLNRYAKIMQINPAHFNNLSSPTIFPLENRCSDLWFRYDWQATDSVSWESLAQQIAGAEAEIKAYTRYSPAPDWEKDVRPWSTYHRHDISAGMDVIGTSYDYLIYPGRRAVSEVLAGAIIVYSDEDGDGFDELATVSATTSLTNVNEIKVYFAGKGGARAWEIRPVKTKVVAGGTLTITIPSIQLVKPEKRELPPASDGVEGLSLLDSDNFIETLDIYREYTDTTAVSAELYWASNCTVCGGTGCASCSLGVENGCAKIVSVNPGFMQAQVASYSSDNGYWTAGPWPSSYDPIQAVLYYQAGFISSSYLNGESYDPLDQRLAQAIAWLATARLERPFCNCGTASALARRLMMDMAITEGDGSKTFSFEDLENPFGTRLGEVWAWKQLKKISGKRLGGFAV